MVLLHKKEKVFWGWWLVLFCSLLSLYGIGNFHYGFSAFVNPVVKELGWSMALASGAFSLYRLEAGVAAPLVGFLIDRVGPTKLVVSGALLMGGGFIYLSQVKTVFSFYMAFIIVSLGFSFSGSQAIATPLISKWFIRKRGKALGIYFAGIGLGGFFVPLLSHFITVYGWRFTLIIMGPVTWVFVVPLAFLLRHKPEQYGLLPDGGPATDAQNMSGLSRSEKTAEVDFPVRDAVPTAAFWFLVLCFCVFQMTMSAVFVHLIPYLITVGIEARTAAVVVTSVTIVSVIGRGGFGWLSDFLSKKWLLIICFLLQLSGIFALTRVRKFSDVIPFSLAYGLSYGGLAVLRPAIVGAYYGRKNFGTIWGMMQAISIFGGLSGPVIVGLIYDARQSYSLSLSFLSLVNTIPLISLIFLRPPVCKKSTVFISEGIGNA